MKSLPIFILASFSLCANASDNFTEVSVFVGKYCTACHCENKQKGDVRLDQLAAVDASTWTDIYEQLASQTMPPSDAPQPTGAERTILLERVLDVARQHSGTASTGLRRLNKREYGNTVRDLLGLRNGTFDPGEYIYEDEIDEGFDTNGQSLVISNELLLEYMGAAEKSLRQALFTSSTAKPKSKITKVRLNKMKGTSRRYINNAEDQVICRSGGKAKLFDGQDTRTLKFPGRYKISVTASGVDRDYYPIRFTPTKGPLIMGFGVAQPATESVSGGGKLLKTFELTDEVEKTFQFDVWIDGGHFPFLSFVNGSSKPITQIRANIRRRKLKPSAAKQPYRGPGIKITEFKIEGPFQDQWPPQSFVTTFDSKTIPDLSDKTAREWLVGRFATRAFRRRVSREEMLAYFDFLNEKHSATGDWHEAVIQTFAAMMSSPDFLYLRQKSSELDSFELASRLSYFLWSSMPDAQLFALAKNGKLREPSILRQQVSRMLDDSRSRQFSTSFADQWLALDKLGSMPPDAKGEFRVYYKQRLGAAMLRETRDYFRYVLEENQSVGDFLDSDYSFINQGLADLYGVPFSGKSADDFTRIQFTAKSQRGGLLGHASVLTLSANGVETSPIERGVWVLSELLGTPPPPPPKEVPALTPDLNGAVTVRDMLVKHRSDPACMECHRRMDPLGFALEAFDPIGRLRTRYSKTQAVSTQGNYLGHDFTNVSQLKKILAADIHPFARNLIIRIAEYAKGRKLVAPDFPAVQSLVSQAAANDYRFKDLLVSIAVSDLITNR